MSISLIDLIHSEIEIVNSKLIENLAFTYSNGLNLIFSQALVRNTVIENND